VRSPAERSNASIMMQVDPLPFVPATWITGVARSGFSQQIH